jgi:hypothetical protein
MQRRLYVPFVLIALLGGLFFGSVKQAYGFQAWIQSVSGDCKTIRVDSSLIWDTDDINGNDRFLLEVYNNKNGALLASFDEQIAREQSPWFWRSHAIEAVGSTHYRIDMWDIDANGKKLRLMDRVAYDCSTGALWRLDENLQPTPVDPPLEGCRSWVPFFSTNLAPEDGVVTITYTHSPWYDTPHYFWAVFLVKEGEGLGPESELAMPCGVYVRAYYQPDSTKQIYYLPAQYWPQTAYGTAPENGQTAPRYYTVFPLNNAPRPDDPFED